jgi:hypothetical protein
VSAHKHFGSGFEDAEVGCELVGKFLGRLWAAHLDHAPLDVVAWHGNYAPYKYDLRTFAPVGAILFEDTMDRQVEGQDTGDYLWSEIERPRERFRPLCTNRFDPTRFQFA